MRIAYFVHDLSDAAVVRRVRMLRRAGAEVVTLGFRRTPSAPTEVGGAPAVDLGRTFDGRLAQRALSVVRQLLRAPRLGRSLAGCDAIIARSLEMLVVAAAARALHRPQARLIYECLDIHRSMLSPRLSGRLLRLVERTVLSRCQLLILSSPAHQDAYFGPFQGLGGRLQVPVLQVENRALELGPGEAGPGDDPPRSPGPPWRMGWFGMLRCRRSFDMLRQIASRLPGGVEVVIGGRPSDREFEDFAAEAARTDGVIFTGGYAPEEARRLYRSVHFAWAIDYFEAGANSDWLLPNRIYESGRYGAVPIALRSVETGRWLEKRGLGLLVDDPVEELPAILAGLDAEGYRALEERSRRAPATWFTAGEQDCRALLRAVAGEA